MSVQKSGSCKTANAGKLDGFRANPLAHSLLLSGQRSVVNVRLVTA